MWSIKWSNCIWEYCAWLSCSWLSLHASVRGRISGLVGLCFEGILQFLWSFLPEQERSVRKTKQQMAENTVCEKNPVVVCGKKSVDQSRIHHVWLLSLPLCRTRLSFNKKTKKCWEEDEGIGSAFVLLGLLRRNYSLFPILCCGWYERHRWEHLEGRSPCLVLLGDLHSLLPVTCSWVPALLLSMPCASISTFPGLGPSLLHSQAGVWKGEEQVLLLRAGPFTSWSAAYVWSGSLSFLAEISGHELVRRSIHFLEAGRGKGSCRGQVKTQSSKKLYGKSNVDFKLSMSLHITVKQALLKGTEYAYWIILWE